MPLAKQTAILGRRRTGMSHAEFQSTGLDADLCELAKMSDETTSPDSENSEIAAVTDNSLITDFTQVVSCVVGLDRAERQRQKIRRELVQQYFSDEQQPPDNMLTRMRKLFGSS